MNINNTRSNNIFKKHCHMCSDKKNLKCMFLMNPLGKHIAPENNFKFMNNSDFFYNLPHLKIHNLMK